MTHTMRAVAVLALLFIAGCAGAPDNTITAEQAGQQAEDYARQALAALPGEARPEISFADTYECDDPTDNGPKGRKIASVDYQIHGLPPGRYAEYVSRLERWWRDHGFRILDDERPARESIWVEHAEDGFRMRVKTNDVGELYLIATSPCVWENGTPDSGR